MGISNLLTDRGIDFIGVRFKDDYRILVKTEEAGKQVIDTIQAELRKVKLHIHEDKTYIKTLPKRLYREHIMRYSQYSFKNTKYNLRFADFERIYYEVMKIDTSSQI